MNRFLDTLEQRGLSMLVQGVEFRKMLPLNAKRFVAAIKQIIESNLKTRIDEDCDPDGYFSGLTIKRMFDKLGYSNYDLTKHFYKRHNLTVDAARTIIREGYKAIILLDSSSNDMKVLEEFAAAGVLVVVVDHHDTQYEFESYPSTCVVVNPRIELHKQKVLYAELSACAICALLADLTMIALAHCSDNVEFYIYGYITLYSDSCNLQNWYNVAYLKRYRGYTLDMPLVVSLFMTKYDALNRNFVSYKLVPRLNAMMRAEKFSLVYDLFYETADLVSTHPDLLNEIETIYKAGKEFAAKLVDEARIEEHENFVIAFLPKGVERIARNYTGLVASNIAEHYGKMALCLMEFSDVDYEGSCRDPFSSDVLSIMKTLCYAEGHPAAFTVRFERIELINIVTALDTLKGFFHEKTKDIMVFDLDVSESRNDLHSEILMMAEYNEFGGQGLPPAFCVKKVDHNLELYRKPNRTVMYWQGEMIIAFSTLVMYGDVMMLSPTLSGQHVELLTKKIGYA